MMSLKNALRHAIGAGMIATTIGCGAGLHAPAASAQSPGCNSNCTDYLRVNLEALPLTRARVDASGGTLRPQFIAYLDASSRQQTNDRNRLRDERRTLSSIPSARPSDNDGTDSMPLNQSASYYAGSAALGIAREIVSFQVPSGGWGKNMRRTGVRRLPGQSYIADTINPDSSSADGWRYVGTIDNGATITEIRYLAKVQAAQATERDAIRRSIVLGLQYLIAAQYPNGGWPQIYPLAGGYNDAITLNDDAMLNVVRLLRDVGADTDPSFAFVDSALRGRATSAANRGIDWFLARQVTIGGRKTLWGQQYDALTQSPTSARAYEMPALASTESAKIVDFLMTIPRPDARVRAAVHGAADFFTATRLSGKRYNRSRGALEDAGGSDAWSRFYDLGLYNPSASAVAQRARALFGDRPDTHRSSSHGLVFGSLVSVSLDRRTGYAQYGNAAQATMSRYATWRTQNPL